MDKLFFPVIEFIRGKEIIQKVERIGIRTLDVFDGNIFDAINAGLVIDNNNSIKSSCRVLLSSIK
jgi:hypothetical protein